jgi:hypothetical protein
MVMMVMVVVVTSAVAVIVVVVMVLMMVVIVASAVAVIIVMMVMLVLVVMMLMLMTTAFAILIVLVVMFVIVVVMLMLVATALAVLIVMMVVFMLVIVVVMATNGTRILVHKLLDMLFKSRSLFKSGYERAYLKLVRRSCDDDRTCILFSYEGKRLGKLRVGGLICVAEKYTACICYLISEKLAEVLHIHFALVDVNYGYRAVKLSALDLSLKNGFSNVRELTYARGLDKDSVGGVLVYHLLECFAEISNERAADAARIHLGYFYSRILEKSAVNTYLTEFIFDKNYLLALIRLVDQTVYKRSFACTEKS